MAPFLNRLGLTAGEKAVPAFTWLVRHGCQPDILAEWFSRAAVPKAMRAGVKRAERITEKLLASLNRAADFAEALLDLVRVDGLATRAPLNLPVTLRDLAEEIRIGETGSVPKSKLQKAYLLGALTHIQMVMGTHRHDEAGQIFNALRAAADQEPIDTDTLVTYAKRRYGRDLRQTLQGDLELLRIGETAPGTRRQCFLGFRFLRFCLTPVRAFLEEVAEKSHALPIYLYHRLARR